MKESTRRPNFKQLTAYSLSGMRVLVIDDEVAIRTGMAAVLESWGCSVMLADSEAEALQQTALQSPQMLPHVIIADHRLRDNKAGVQAIIKLRQASARSIPALIITGDTAPERLREAQASGHTLMHKPIQPAKLRAYLSGIRRRETLLAS